MLLVMVGLACICATVVPVVRAADAPKARAKAMMDAGDFKGAVEAYTQALAAAPDDAELLRERGRARNRLKDYKAAIADFDAALQRNPKDAQAFNLRGNAKKGDGESKAALADFERAIKFDPRYAAPYANRGVLRREAGDTAGALQDYDQALELAPRDELALGNRASLRAQLGAVEGALTDFDRALAVNPKNKVTHSNRGSLLFKLGRTREALVSFDYAVTLDPNDALSCYNRGLTREKLGDAAGAKADFEQAVKLDPNNSLAWKHLAAATNTPATTIAAALNDLTTILQPAAANPPAPPSTAKTVAASTAATTTKPAANPVPPSAGSTIAPDEKAKPAPAPAPVAVAAPKSHLVTPPSPPPVPPRTQSAEVLATAGRRPGFRLFGSEFPCGPDNNGSYTNKGRSGGYHFAWDSYAYDLRWTVPEVIVPGLPAKFRIECSTSGGSQTDARILFETTGQGSVILRRTLAGVRIYNEVDCPPVPVDEFDLVLPDITDAPQLMAQGQGERKLKIRFRSQEIDQVVEGINEGCILNRKIPSELPIEEVEHLLVHWLTWDSKFKEYGELKITVLNRGSVYAIYNYRWTPDCGPAIAEDPVEADHLELVASPAARKELRADSRDGLWLMARLMPKSGEPGPALQAASSAITFGGAGEGAPWLDFSDPVGRDGWKLIYVQASNPDVVRGPRKPPANLVVQADATSGGKTLSRQITLAVTPEAEIDAKPDAVDFALKTGQSAKVRVLIDNPGKDPWKFHAEYAPKNRSLAKVSLVPTGGAAAEVNLQEAGLEPISDGTNSEVSVLRIIAEQKDREPLERDIKVRVGQEGLFVLATGRDSQEGCYRVLADGTSRPTEVDFQVFILDPTTQKLVSRKDAVGKLEIQCLELEGSLAAQVIKLGQLQTAYGGIRSANEPSGIYRFTCAKEIPGDGRIIKADYRVSYAARDEEAFTAIITLGLVTTSNGPGGKDWQIELDRCQEIINRLVPTAYCLKLQSILDRHKRTLGAEGLHNLRNQLWRIAMDLTLGEGGQGYANEAAWADDITCVLEWSQWAGDMAFGAVMSTVTSPYGAVGANTLKSTIISAINAYQEGRGPSEWLWENLCTLPGLVEGKVIDPSAFEKWGMESKAKAWAIYIGYHFCKNLYAGATVIEALKNTSKEAGSNLLSGWLSEQVKMSTAKAPVVANGKRTPEEEAATKTGAPLATVEANAAQQIRSRMSTQGGKTYANAEDVLAIMRDPSKVRALKNASPEIQAAFSNTREAIYREHDTAVVQHIKDTMPDMKYRMVKVLEFRTPGDTGASLNTDRDYRVCYYSHDARTGRGQWIEIDRRNWESQSYQAFARATGGPADSPEAARRWAEEHQQLATDKAHAEASPAFTDQAKVWNPGTRRFEETQIVPNITRVKAGQPGVSLKDPLALGQMYQMKVADARFKHEAFVQAQKAVKELDAVMTGYQKQKRNVGVLPPSIVEGMNAVLTVNKKLAADPNRRDPVAIAEAEKTLRANGFSDLNDFMNKLGGQFESLKTAR
jgi:tetratricopeptide (TPR) repeat protein